MFHKPRALRPSDRVAVVAPAGPFDRESFEAGLAVIAARYRVQCDAGIFQQHRYLAGDDARRVAELNAALGDPDIRAVFCARGGYGSLRLLTKLTRPRSPSSARQAAAGSAAPTLSKPLVGFSDITALHQWYQRYGLISIHAPVLTQLGRLGESTWTRLFALLESGAPAAPLYGKSSFVEGTAEGPLLGGNMSVFTRLLGTPFMPPLEGSILLLEDVGERPYSLDRMWTHLALAGVFEKVKGIVLGCFIRCEERDAQHSGEDVLRELATATGLPCAAGFPIGHGDVNEPVALGARVRLDAGSRTLTFLESAVSE